VLFTTGYARDAIRRSGMLDPGSTLLSKPFGLDQLAERVRAVLDGPPWSADPAARGA
jgi:DNA-binding response OmpR family regulator